MLFGKSPEQSSCLRQVPALSHTNLYRHSGGTWWWQPYGLTAQETAWQPVTFIRVKEGSGHWEKQIPAVVNCVIVTCLRRANRGPLSDGSADSDLIRDDELDRLVSEGCTVWDDIERRRRLFVDYGEEAEVTLTQASTGGRTALHDASERGDRTMVELLLSSQETRVDSTDRRGKTALHVAVSNGHDSIVDLLLQNGADVNAKEANAEVSGGRTSLHLASKRGDKGMVEQLLTQGADVNAKTNDGLTALQVALVGGRLNIVKCLVEAGADVNVEETELKRTALHIFSEHGDWDMVKLLLRKGAAVDATDRHGQTPLHRAVLNGQQSILELLLEYGADVNVKDVNANGSPGMTALELAIHIGEREMVTLLQPSEILKEGGPE
uniref:Uncharacterized protein n=1 Tax=Chromera velia CCMP2878 TaxID=1169474 RepID=A0A0G4HP08_9ALVE|eukprot:Cvel_29674.t1-p1 / transcript=Cvel_29674.t1 / gene=Cvel_29674 / organism=Chromera_velia_CCMP2878 / gene_product=Putative ankyrin repeat protein RF_0381, putative / transcript_product=Putative ankyrin repeat protein RF_0381, putative / location=Cvel_scaffold4103:4228-6479(+) / protein_length=380 / sequence_SO=supercontig / SO=protein_coding / is_pseudo=false